MDERMRFVIRLKDGESMATLCRAAIWKPSAKSHNWRVRKIRERLLRRLPHAVKVATCLTIHTVLDRHGLVKHSIRRGTRTEGTPLSEGLAPTDLW